MSELLIINGSARLNGDTQKVINKLTEGLVCTQINLVEHHLMPYNYNAQYPEDDSFKILAKEILYHPHILLATPVYWFSMSGRMKQFLDRLTDWVTADQETGRKLKDKTMQLLAVGTDGELPDGFTAPFYMTANYFDMSYKGHLYFNAERHIEEAEIIEIRKSFFSFIAHDNN